MKILIGPLTSDGSGGHACDYRCPQCCEINTATAAQLRGTDPITCSNCNFERRAFVYVETDDGSVSLVSNEITPIAGKGLTSPEVDGPIIVDLTHTVDGDDVREEMKFAWVDGSPFTIPDDTTVIHGARAALSGVPVWFDSATFPLHGPHSEPWSTFTEDESEWGDWADGPFRIDHPELCDSIEVPVRLLTLSVVDPGDSTVVIMQGVDQDELDEAEPTGPDGDGNYVIALNNLVKVVMTPAIGHAFDSLTVDGDTVSVVTTDFSSTYQFPDPITDAHALVATFVAI